MKWFPVAAKTALVFMFVAVVGCATDLEPAPSAVRVAGLEDAARATTQGVDVLAQAGDWPGPADIRREVTPLRIRIDNDSGRSLRVRYNEFNLVGPEGATFAALPLARIEGEIAVLADVTDVPGFTHRGFAVAPYYAPNYPGIDPYPGYFPMDSYYYDTYYHHWIDVDLPTAEMRRQVLPEGVVDSGGSLEGWLFFEPVDDERQRVVLRVDLVDADTGRKFGEIRIPFRME